MKLSTMLLNRRQLKSQAAIFLNKQTLNTKASQIKKLKLLKLQMKFPESKLMFSMQLNKMKF